MVPFLSRSLALTPTEAEVRWESLFLSHFPSSSLIKEKYEKGKGRVIEEFLERTSKKILLLSRRS